MTKNSKYHATSHMAAATQSARSNLKGIQKQFGDLQHEQRLFKGEILDLAKKALASRNDSGWEDLTALIAKLESL